MTHITNKSKIPKIYGHFLFKICLRFVEASKMLTLLLTEFTKNHKSNDQLFIFTVIFVVIYISPAEWIHEPEWIKIANIRFFKFVKKS